MEGTVKWFNSRKGYGFIKGDDGEEYFVHNSALSQGRFLRDNDKVSFEPTESERGKQAQNVSLLQKGSEMPKEETKQEETKQEETKQEETKQEETEQEETEQEETEQEETEQNEK